MIVYFASRTKVNWQDELIVTYITLTKTCSNHEKLIPYFLIFTLIYFEFSSFNVITQTNF